MDMINERSSTYGSSHFLEISLKKQEIKQISGIIYEQASCHGYPNMPMALDLLQPQQEGPLPLVIFLTGGGFIFSNRDNGVQLRYYLAERGYAVASVAYRVTPGTQFPGPLEDVKGAVRYLRSHAERWNLDATRIALVGASAGGYLASFAGITNGVARFDKGENLQVKSDVSCAVSLYGPSDLSKAAEDYREEIQAFHRSEGSLQSLFVNGIPQIGGSPGGLQANPERAAAANPLCYISKKSSPILLMHGSEDLEVSPSQTDLLFQALRAQGIPSERYVIPGAGHGGAYWVQDEVLQVIESFIRQYLEKRTV